MKNYIRHIGYAITIWVFLVIINTFFNLMNLENNTKITTFFGVELSSTANDEELWTYFALTPITGITAIVFILIWLAIYAVFHTKSNEKQENKQ
ncbi:MAG: hypothetical protein J6M18_04290 [Actinomycetaceae bacterium]|nr:hypothetical protein [Actinomycetaceae bacterium]